MPLHVGTWNCRVSVPLPKVRLDLTGVNEDGEKVAPGLLSHVEVLGLQEWGGKDRERLLERLDGYDYAKPGSRTGSVLWSTDRFRLCRARAVTAAEGRNVGRIPGLRMILRDYEVAVVTLRDITTGSDHRDQDRVTVINGHAPVWRPGQRARMHAEWLAKVAELHAEYADRGDIVFTLADFNRTPRHIRGRFAEHANAVSLWTHRKIRPTHHRRSIDDIYHRCRARHVALIDTASDHRAVLATY